MRGNRHKSLKRRGKHCSCKVTLTFGNGKANIDIICKSDGSEARTVNCSFDGHGATEKIRIDMDVNLCKQLMDLVPNEMDEYDVPEDHALAIRTQTFFTQNMAKVPEVWRDAFVECGVVL